MPTTLALRHVAFEDLGLIEPLLAARGHQVRYVEAGVGDIAACDPLEDDLVVVLGGPIGATDDAAYPFLADIAALLARRLAAGGPTLGICLGAQLMARALGAAVYRAPEPEIGWGPVTLTEAGEAGPLAALGPEPVVLHWHGDTFDLPEGAQCLASSAVCPNQAFAYGPAALGLQFHAEVPAEAVERWLIGHTVEIAAAPGVSVAGLRAGTARHAAEAATRGQRCFTQWLDSVGL